MSEIKTNCTDCVFALRDKDHQSSCTLNRHEKLKVVDTTEDNYFLLERFCNTYRPQEWIEELDLEEQMELEATVLNEVRPRMGFFIRLDTSVPDAIDRLDKTLQSCIDMNGGPAYIAVITDKVEYNEEIWTLFIKHFGENSDIKYHIVQLEAEFEELPRILDEAFTHAQNGWIYVTSSGKTVPKDTLDILHKRLNIDLLQIMMVEPYDNLDGLMFPAFVFKFLNGNKTKIFAGDEKEEDPERCSLPFIDKMKEAEKRGETKSIFTLEEFNAS
tara:strand:+ start:2912 stop:3727 length:816 start_codon:yes stop_codon:yes gene_type:complete